MDAQVAAKLLQLPDGVLALARQLGRSALVKADADVERIAEVANGADVDLVEVLVEALLPALGTEVEEVGEGGAHVHDIVLVALDGEALDGGVGERRERVDDILDGEEGGEVDLAQLLQRLLGVLRVRESLGSERSVERALVNSMADVAHDALRAGAVIVIGLVVAAAKVEDLERAVDRRAFPLRVAEVSIANAELFESGKAEKGGEPEFAAKDGVVGDVIVAPHDWNEGASADEVGGMHRRAGNAVEGEVAEVWDGGGNGDDETLAPGRKR